MKTIVVNQRDQEEAPFLRGILVRSLLDTGLSFEEAHAMATEVRDALADTKKITSEDLQRRVVHLLKGRVDRESLEQYRFPSVAPSRIYVTNLSSTTSAFSRGRHARYLQSAGMKAEKAEYTTELIYAQLITAGISSISTCELGYLTFLCLQQEVGKKAAKRYLVWSEFQRSARPLVLLIGGTVATGKSTIATEIAHLLEIVRIQSTDMLREVMRMMVPKRLLPVLHTSSFNAWKTLPIQDKEERDRDQLVAEGYQSQARLLAVPCEAVLQRAVEESVPIILEGVHVHPDLLKHVPGDEDAIKVYVLLAVLKSKKLKSRLRGRGVEVPQRRAKRYLDSLESIWSLQSFLLSEADRCDVPIITTEDKETAIRQIIQQVNAELAKHFTGSIEQVFGGVVDELKQKAETDDWHDIVPLLRGRSRQMKQAHQPDKESEPQESRRKCALLIIDGLGDLPNTELDGKTPLEAAHTPVFDQLAGAGSYGLVDPIIPGKIPNTHSGTGMLMGLLAEQADRLHRGPVEASGAGKVLAKGDIAMRANFASVESQDGTLLVNDRRAGRITAGTDELAAVLTDVDLGDGVSASLVPTDQHRGVLVLSGPGLDAAISNTDPGDSKMPAVLKTCLPLRPEAELTAAKVNRFIAEAHRRLVDHPINIARVAAGKPGASGIITRGAGAQFELDNILRPLGINAAVVSGCNTVRGLGRIFGFDAIVDSRFTATVDTDLHAKIAAVESALEDHDMVFLHAKAPDVCSHDRQPLAKRDFLQRLDAALEPLLSTGIVIAIAADHTTDSNTGFHTADPVPALIWQPDSNQSDSSQSVEPVKFGEAACRQGNMDRQSSTEFLLRVLRTMGYQSTE